MLEHRGVCHRPSKPSPCGCQVACARLLQRARFCVQWYGHSVTRDSAKFCSGSRRQRALVSDARPPRPLVFLDETRSRARPGSVAGRRRPSGGIKERKGKPPMRHATPQLLPVTEAAIILGVAPRTVRRWLHEGHLAGQKIGASWVVLCPTARASSQTRAGETVVPQNMRRTPAVLRQRLRHLGGRLITVGNAVAGARRARGEVFLTWRRPERLPIIFAIGRASPTRGWTPYSVGTELPFWLTERRQWRPVQRLLKQYEQLRHWCHPRLLRLPQVMEMVKAELHRLHTAIEACATQGGQEEGRQARCVDDA
jgi:excisionase family DNA binding protein